jgi:uncharacterized membrane-anchored protein YitT (DUF2179 family)
MEFSPITKSEVEKMTKKISLDSIKAYIKKQDWKKILRQSIMVFLSAFILAVAVELFIANFELVSGGVTGISIALEHICKNAFPQHEFLDAEFWITIFTWVFFFIGLLFLGKEFAIKTLLFTILYPGCIYMVQGFIGLEIFGGYFTSIAVPGNDKYQIGLILAAVVGGALVGLAIAIAFMAGSSTGGVDIISYAICKFFPKLKISKITLLIDATIVVLGMFAMKDFVLSLLGIISAAVTSFMIDKVFLGGSRAFIAQIVSEKTEEIRIAIRDDMDRTSTIIDCVGGYSGEDKKLVMVSFTMSQYALLMSIIDKVDKTAFVTIHRAHEINGLGFSIEKRKKNH